MRRFNVSSSCAELIANLLWGLPKQRSNSRDRSYFPLLSCSCLFS
jgi:hypothetical protein